MGTSLMSKALTNSPLLRFGESNDASVVILKKMNEYAKGYYTLSDKEIVTFLSRKPFFLYFNSDNLLHLSSHDDEDITKKLQTKKLFLEDSSSLIFNKPKIKLRSLALDLAKKHSGKELNTSEAYTIADDIDKIDDFILSKIKENKKKEKKSAPKKEPKKIIKEKDSDSGSSSSSSDE